MEQDFVDIILLVSYGLLVLAAIAAIILPLINAIGNPKSLIKGLAGVLLIVVVFGISYSLSGSEVTATYMKFGINEGLSQFIGASIITVYILLVVSIAGIIITEVSKIFS